MIDYYTIQRILDNATPYPHPFDNNDAREKLAALIVERQAVSKGDLFYCAHSLTPEGISISAINAIILWTGQLHYPIRDLVIGDLSGKGYHETDGILYRGDSVVFVDQFNIGDPQFVWVLALKLGAVQMQWGI